MIKTKSQLDKECIARIQSTLPTLHIDVNGTACKTMLEAFTASIADCYIDLETETRRNMVDTATGIDLDNIGNSRNIYRAPGENDTLYRNRVINFFSDNNSGTLSSILNALYKLDGVAQVIHRPYAVGLGSFILYLVPTGSYITSTLLNRAQSIVDNYEAIGVRGIVRSAIIISIQIRVNLTFAKDVSNINTTSIKTQCSSAIVNYLNNLQVGEPLVITELITRCKNVSTSISDLYIEYIKMNGRSSLIRNYYPQEFEIIRPALNTAVVIV